MAVIDNNAKNIFDLVAETASKINPLDPNAAAKLASLFNEGNEATESTLNNKKMSFVPSDSMKNLAKKANQQIPPKLSPTGGKVKGF